MNDNDEVAVSKGNNHRVQIFVSKVNLYATVTRGRKVCVMRLL